MMPKKPKANSSIEISKISGIDLTMRCINSKRSNDMIYMEPNENFNVMLSGLRGRLYMHISIIEIAHFSSC